RISGAPDQEEMGVTSIPASFKCFAVPPVERISAPCARSAFASSMIPLLSETERMARSIRMLNDARTAHRSGRTHVAACFPPDVEVKVHQVGDGVRIADRRHAECRRSVVEFSGRVADVIAKIFLAHQRRVTRRPLEGAVEVLRQRESWIEAV